MPGVFDFYRDRIASCPSYGLKAGEEILSVIVRCALHDKLLTTDDFSSIINLCLKAHIKMLEEDFNNGWHEQNPEG